MTPKQIHYSEHAAKRLKQRGITREGVRTLLAVGLWAREGDGIFSRTGYLGSREAKMYYREGGTRIYVITVEWTDEG